MKVKNDGLILREKTVEIPIREAAGMLCVRFKPEEINHIYKAQMYIGEFIPEQNTGG